MRGRSHQQDVGEVFAVDVVSHIGRGSSFKTQPSCSNHEVALGSCLPVALVAPSGLLRQLFEQLWPFDFLNGR